MYTYLGDFPAGATIFFPFHTFDSAGASVTLTGLAATDIEIYKGASMTQRASDAGYALVDTDGIDLDGVTGIHGFTVDTSDNTDAGFYAAGNDYTVVVSSVTIDSQTVNFIAGRFSIDNRGLLRPTTASRTLDVSSTGAAGIDLNNIELPVGAVPALGIIDNGTLQSATASTAVIRAAAALGDDIPNNSVLEITGGTGAGQVRLIVDYVTATDTTTVNPNWTTTPDATSTYIIRAAPPAPTAATYMPAVNVGAWLGTAPATPTVAGVPEVDLTHIAGSTTDVSTLAASVAAILVDTAEIGAAGAGLTEAGGTGDQLTALATAAAQATAQADLDTLTGADGVTLAGSQPNYAPATAAAVTAIEADTQDIQSRLPAALDNGHISASVKRVGTTELTAAGTGGQGYGAA